jgi:hypothetical protein
MGQSEIKASFDANTFTKALCENRKNEAPNNQTLEIKKNLKVSNFWNTFQGFGMKLCPNSTHF